MTDTTQTKPPSITSFRSMVFTGLGSGAIGDQIADAFNEISTWLIQLECSCIIPDSVAKAIHTLWVTAIMAIAFWLHYLIVKPKGE